jgi:phosphatidate cytidylyltransferase
VPIKSNRSIVIFLGIPGILLLTWLGGIYFGLFILIVMLLALTEFYTIAKLKGYYPQFLIGWIAVILFSYFFYNYPKINFYNLFVICSGLVIFTLFFEMFRNKPNASENFGITLGGIFYIPLLLGTLIGIRNFDSINSTNFTFALFISVWICDSAAFVAGKYFGKKKIYPRISPNKTVVGCVAGVIFAFLTFFVMDNIGFINTELTIMQLIILSIITGVFGQAGDFAESLFKRDAQVKDSGSLLLGHGGVMDRFDSLTIASPLIFVFLNFYY